MHGLFDFSVALYAPRGFFRVLLYVLFLAASMHAATLPPGFSESQFGGAGANLASPTAMAFAPDGRLFVCQQGGSLRVIKNGALLPTPFVTLSVDPSGERGLLGVAFDPNFAANQFVYVYYTTSTAPIHNRVSRFTANGDVAAGGETIIFDLDNLSAPNHNGGAIHFGADGKLYIAAGENGIASNAQSFNNLLGKILRINPDGTIPPDNPFLQQTSGRNQAIWVMGLRNPFTFNFQPGAGRMFINDVGQSAWEEINDGLAGRNYGWPTCEGNCNPPNPNLTNPLHQYAHDSNGGCAIVGATFYNPTVQMFPVQYAGKYFFADLCMGWIRYVDPASPQTATGFATGLLNPVDLQVGPDGALYYLQIGNGGQVWRVATIPQITGLMYYPLPHPIRLFDTRAPIQGETACAYLNQPLNAGQQYAFQARVTCGDVTIPATALAIVGNATVVNPASNGYVTLWPNGQARPTVSNLNYLTGQIVPNSFTIGLGGDGQFQVYSVAATHFIVDVTGYFAPPGVGGLYYHSLAHPIRLFDTRAPIPGATACEYLSQPLAANSELAKQARITCDGLTIPADAQVITGNATVVTPAGSGYITLWPNGQARPTVSNLNYLTGQIVPNAFTVGLGADGQFRIYTVATTHFIVDVAGYYSPSAMGANGTGLLYAPLATPIRLFDTRAPIPGALACEYLSQPLAANSELAKQARITCGAVTIPAGAQAITGNATVVTPAANGYITLWPNGQARPTVSNLNYLTGQIVPNAFTVGLGADGQFRIYTTTATHFIVDVAGYYAP